jgi:RHS repeat-associated protein
MVNGWRQPHKYTTYERDANGSDEAMYRRYEGRWQRFAQPDPADSSYDLTNPQTLNRYSYTFNDPVNFVDPDGRNPFAIVIAVGVLAVTGFPINTVWSIGTQAYFKGWRNVDMKEALISGRVGSVASALAPLTAGSTLAAAALGGGAALAQYTLTKALV